MSGDNFHKLIVGGRGTGISGSKKGLDSGSQRVQETSPVIVRRPVFADDVLLLFKQGQVGIEVGSVIHGKLGDLLFRIGEFVGEPKMQGKVGQEVLIFVNPSRFDTGGVELPHESVRGFELETFPDKENLLSVGGELVRKPSKV